MSMRGRAASAGFVPNTRVPSQRYFSLQAWDFGIPRFRAGFKFSAVGELM